MSLLQTFIQYIRQQNLFQRDQPLIIAVSGGVDSVVLAHLCHEAGFRMELAHCNFQLRGEESTRDQLFVTNLAERLHTRLHFRLFDTKEYITTNNVSVQVAARELRYAWFDELVQESAPGARALTAHHLDDSVETSLMNFFKGTGIAGLRGIMPKNGHVVRPLLFASREEIMSYAEENQIEFVQDSSNAENKYTRNFFRNQLIPLVKTVFPEAEQNLFNNQVRFREIEMLYRQAIDVHTKKLLIRKGVEWQIPINKLLRVMPLTTIVYELVKGFGFMPSQVEGIIALADSISGKQVSSATHRIIRNRNWFIIAPIIPAPESIPSMLVIEHPGEYTVGEYSFMIGASGIDLFTNPLTESDPRLQMPDPHLPAIAFADSQEIIYPLILRPARTGDYFYPLGMKKKKKKLARFFIDLKLSKTEKEKQWVLESNRKIIWVAGLRLDERFRVTHSSSEVVKMQWRRLTTRPEQE